MFSSLSKVISLLLTTDYFVVNIFGITCDDACGNPNATGSTATGECIVFNNTNDNVVGCYGTFTGPIIGNALDLCNRTKGEWHMCENANYASILGLEANAGCEAQVPANHVFWSLEATGSDRESPCFTNSGVVTDSRPFNNVWGCAGGGTYFPGVSYEQCGTQHRPSFNIMIDAGSTPLTLPNYGLQFCGGQTVISGCGDGQEQILLEALDSTKYGVVCCRSDPVFEPFSSSSCDDSITLVDFYFYPRYTNGGDYNFAPYLGKFTYAGPDSNGYPRYVNWNAPTSSGNSGDSTEISLIVEPGTTNTLVISITIPDYGTFYISSANDGSVVAIPGTQFTYEVEKSLFNAQEIPVILAVDLLDETTTNINNDLVDLRVRLLFNDCVGGQGLELSDRTEEPTSLPTAVPTNAPTNPTANPTASPTVSPTGSPTDSPTVAQTPAPTDATPAPTDATPAPSDPTPAPTDATPAPTDATPAPTDATPAPTDPTPAPSDPTLAPTDPTLVPTPHPSDPTASPTASPTPAPSGPTPGPTPGPVGSQCENYDHTIYSSCTSDPFCSECELWGCASCVSGYYKRGLLKRCQSCADNYPNCAQCGDWNGCTQCNSGYTLAWNGVCSDETCQ